MHAERQKDKRRQLTAMSPGGRVHPTLEACSSRKSTTSVWFCEAASQVTLVCVCSECSDSSPGNEACISASTLHEGASTQRMRVT